MNIEDTEDTEEDITLYYEAIVDGYSTVFKCLICQKVLSRKQRIEDHLKSKHNKGSRKRKYKKYLDDSSVPFPRQTKFNQTKHSSLFPELLVDSTSAESHSQAPDDEYGGSNTSSIENTSQELFDFDVVDCNNFYSNDDDKIDDANLVENDEGHYAYHEDTDVQFQDDGESSTCTSENLSSDDLSDSDNESIETIEDTNETKQFSSQEVASMAILSLVSRHCLTNEAAKDIIGLLKMTCPEIDGIQNLSYPKVQEICGNCEITIHDFCDKCLRLFPVDLEDEFRCSTTGCNGLRYKGNINQQCKKIHKNGFVTVNIFNQLRDLLEREGMWNTIQKRISERGKPDLTDIIDGQQYLSHCEPGNLLHNPANISLIFNTDGAPLYSSSSVSLWPIFLSINELPSPDRFSKRNMIMWGIWQGKGKPPFNTYFQPFADEMTKLYNEGIVISPAGQLETTLVKAALLLGSTDLQGKAYLLYMTQHNGQNGCVTCKEPGVVVPQGRGHTRCYPYKAPEEAAAKRTTESLLQNAVRAHETKSKVSGMFDVTSLAAMPWFDIVMGMVPDYMHGCLLGITKTLLYKWFSSTNYRQEYFVGGQISQINERVMNMKPPDTLARLPRDLEKHFRNLKASELQAWLLYYSIPSLIGFLPDKYLKHFAHFSEAIHILLGDCITRSQLARARDLLQSFYKEFATLYGEGSSGLNVHNAGAHLVDYVEAWGPLWAWSTFGFEDMNGTLMDLVHGTGNVCKQLIWMLHAQSRLVCEAQLMQAGTAKTYIQRLLNTKRELKNLKEATSCQIAGGIHKFAELPEGLNDISRETHVKVLRIVKNGQTYFSKQYTRMVRRNCTVVLFKNGIVGEIQYFAWDKDSGKVLAIFNEIKPDLAKPFFFEDVGSHVLRMKSERSMLQLANVEEIKEKVIFLDGNDEHHCLVRQPNFNGVCG